MKYTSAMLLLYWIIQGNLLAQWSHDPTVNTVLDKPGDQRAPLLTTDGKGGAIVAWNEDRGVFANWVDRFGFRQWGNDGVRITPTGRIAGVTNILSDGEGGAVIVWDDYTNAREVGFEVVDIIENEIFVQRVDSLGQLVWEPDGIGVRTGIDSTSVGDFGMVTSDSKEFIVVWTDDRARPYPMSGPIDLYAQKINLAGDLLWQANGALITLNGGLTNPRRRQVTDGAGGFLLARFDNDPNAQQATVVERISSEGELLWQAGGVPVHTGGAFEMDSDGQGGAVVAGIFFPGGGFVGQVKIQRVNKGGELLWGDSATVVMDGTDLFTAPRIVSDGNAGTIIWWEADDSTGARKGFFQHIDSEGNLLWSPIPIRFNLATTIHPIVISDQQGGMVLTANDFNTAEGDFWAVKVDFDGNLVWQEEGVLFRLRPFNDWPFLFDVIDDGSGGFIATWSDFNNITFADVVLQQVSSNGILGEVITHVEQVAEHAVPEQYSLQQNYPNPFNPETRISFAIKRAGLVSLIIYDLSGKEVISLVQQKLAAGEHRLTWDGKDKTRKKVASGVYFSRLQVNGFQAVRKMVYIR